MISDTSAAHLQPLVSVVIPTFNHARYLARAIESVLLQDYPRIELIVIDDGSSDGTRAILDSTGSALRWEWQQNAGQAAALNKGWSISSGEILSYLSADDRLLQGAVAAAVEALRSNRDAVLTYCNFDVVGEDDSVLTYVRAPEFDYVNMVVNTVCIPGPGVFFRRTAYERTGGWDPRFRQMPDLDYWLRLGLIGRFEHIPKRLAQFRSHERSQTFAKPSVERAEEPVQILENYYRSNPHLPDTVAALRARATGSAHLTSAQLHLRAGRYTTALRHIKIAMRSYWKHALHLRTYKLCIHGLFGRAAYTARAWLRQAGNR